MRREALQDRHTVHVVHTARGTVAVPVLTEHPELAGAGRTAPPGPSSEPRPPFDANNHLDLARISATGATYRGAGRLARTGGARPIGDVTGETMSTEEPIMPDTVVLRAVRDVVTDTARAHGWPGEDVIPDTQNLLDDGPRLDSLAVADLLVRIEQRFGIVIDESVLDPADIGSIAGLVNLITTHLGTDRV